MKAVRSVTSASAAFTSARRSGPIGICTCSRPKYLAALAKAGWAEWGASSDGGYVTTDKSNILIALAPYFVPLWAALTVGIYACVGVFVDLSPAALKSLYGLLGFFWAFHLLWTLWMIPRDQPDLRENGTFLSLIIIYLANLLILVSLTCLASPGMSFQGFVIEWLFGC